jgi:hypothetical protein
MVASSNLGFSIISAVEIGGGSLAHAVSRTSPVRLNLRQKVFIGGHSGHKTLLSR